MSESPVYRVYFTNFGYYSSNVSSTEDGARKVAKLAGYQASIEKDGKVFLSYCPSAGFRNWFPDGPAPGTSVK